MPTVNLTARKLRVRIGADLQDWSAAVSAFTAEESGLSEDGLKQVEGQLFIKPIPNPPESIDPYENPSRWRPGTPVLIEVTGDGGGWIVPRYGRLFILEEPDFPDPGQGINVQVGCRLTWHNTYEFDDDATGLVGTPINSATVAQRLLEANEIASEDISLGTWPYDLSIPEGKGPNGSFIQQAGELAYANDWRYLYQNVSGTIVSAALNLGIASPLITITLGTNDVLYQPAKVDTAGPPDVLRVAAESVAFGPVQNPAIEVSEVIGDKSEITYDDPFFGLQSCYGTGPIARSTTQVWWDAENHYTETIEEGIFYALTVTDFGWRIGSGCGLVPFKRTLVQKIYDPTDKRLLRTVTSVWQRGFTLSKAFNYGALSSSNLNIPRLLERTVERYYPADNEVLERIETEKEVALWTLNPNASGRRGFPDDPARMINLGTSITKWKNIGGNTWQKSSTELLPKSQFDSSPEGNPATVRPNISTSISNTGNNQPPRLEFWDYDNTESSEEFVAELTYTIPGGGSGRTRKRLYTLPYGFSQEQCENIANLHLGLIAGRHRAALIEFPVSDALLTAAPLFPCNVVLPSGEIRHYRIDALAWEHTANQAKVAGVGILVGTTSAPTEEDPNPTPVPLTGTLVVDDTVSVVDSDALIYEVV